MVFSLTQDTEIQQYNSIEGNSVIFSSLLQFYNKLQSEGFALKYVKTGVEHYFLNRTHHQVYPNQYLLCNQAIEGYCEFNSKKLVNGICINLKNELLYEVIASYLRPDASQTDLNLGQYFTSNLFLESVNNAQDSKTGRFIENLTNKYSDIDDFDSDFFYSLAQNIVEDQIPFYRKLQQIPAIKWETRKELLKKILKAQELIKNEHQKTLSVPDYAREVGISEFHFYRLFKAIHNVSPKQYLIENRLNTANKLIKNDKNNITEIAGLCGYSDIFSFSKAYKKQFGYAPSHLI